MRLLADNLLKEKKKEGNKMGDMILMLEMTTSGPGQAVNKSLG